MEAQADSKRTKEQIYELLCYHPNSEVARMIGVSKQRTFQLRAELQVPITSKEARVVWNLARGKSFYDLMMSYRLRTGSKSREWRLAAAYARSADAPWPPQKQGTTGQKVYDYAVAHPEYTWHQINEDMDLNNSCSVAGEYARSRSKLWPLRGGKGPGPRRYNYERILEKVESSEEVVAHLEGLVHDLKSKEASAINNGGPIAQLDYCLQYLPPARVAKELKL